MNNPDTLPATHTQYRPKMYGLALLVSIIVMAGMLAVYFFSANEMERSLRGWQDKLNLIAESRAADVSGWVRGNFKELTALADNASLQLYLTDLQNNDTDAPAGTEPSQTAYLRNLLLLTAERSGFEIPSNSPARQIEANVSRTGQSGIAVVDMENHMLVATPSMPPIEGALAERISLAPKASPTLIDMEPNAAGRIQIGFIVPIYAIQGDRDESGQIGRIVGVRILDDSFYNLLKHPGVTEQTLEAYLVRPEKENIVYLTPLKDGAAPFSKRLLADEKLDAAYAVTHPGGFAVKQDYHSKESLVTGRAIGDTPWTLVVKISRAEAMAASDKWRGSMMLVFLMAILCVVAALIAVWRHASSKKAYELSVRSAQLAEHSAAQEKLLRLVADNQPTPIYIVDRAERFWFANKKTAEQAGISIADLMGKSIPSVLGPERARMLIEANRIALSEGKPYAMVRQIKDKTGERMVLSEHIPLPHIPVEALPTPSPGVLVVEQDLTAVMAEREKRVRALDQLVATLIKLVDQRDPYAGNHSAYVARVARRIAQDMGLDEATVETTEVAGKLLNIGKIVVPAETLTKAGSLNEKEKEDIRSSILASANLLQHVDFNGPVVATLRQAQENWDGSGPMKLKGEAILLSARILHVVNAFIGMVSPRSYRAAISVDAATKFLLEQVDKQFDRKVVVALVNYLDNHEGRASLEQGLNKK